MERIAWVTLVARVSWFQRRALTLQFATQEGPSATIPDVAISHTANDTIVEYAGNLSEDG